MAIYTSALYKTGYYLKLEVKETGTNAATNKSTLAWRLWIQSTNGYYFSQIRIGAKIVIAGTTVVDRAWSGSSQFNCGVNSATEDIASGTVEIAHNADGTKTIGVGAITAQNTTQTGNVCPNMSLSSGSALVLTTIPRASTITISTNTTVMGQARTITITRQNETYRHKLFYKFAAQSSYTAITSGYITGTTQSFTPPVSLISLLTNAASGTGTILCETYTSSGTTAIGSSTISFTATIPKTVPTLSGGTWIGDALTVSLTGRADPKLSHTISYQFGTQASATSIASQTAEATYTWTPTAAQKAGMVQAVAANSISGTGTISVTTYNGTASVGTATKTWTGKIPASTVAAGAVGTMGSAMGFTITRAGTNLTHKLEYTFGSSSDTIGTGLGASASWTPAKSLAAQVAANNASKTGTVTLTTYNGTATIGTTTATFTLRIPASTFTRSSATVTMGDSQTFTITRAASNLTHKLTYAFGSLSGQSIGTGIGTSKSWTVPKTLAAQLTNAASGTVTVACTTYNGTAVCGSAATLTFTLTIPASTAAADATGTMGSAMGFTITRAASNLTHTIAYTFGTKSGMITTKTTGTAVSWTPAKSLAAEVAANNATKQGSITITTYNGTATVGTQTATFTLRIPVSTASFPQEAVLIGSTQTITIARAASNLTHAVSYTFGSISAEAIASAAGASQSWTLPAKMAAQVAAGTIQKTGSIKITTYNGTATIGSVTVTFTAKIPPSTLAASSTSVTLGGSCTFTITPIFSAATNIKHRLSYTAGSAAGVIADPASSGVSWTVPKALAAQAAANASTVPVTVTLTTFNGTAEVGTKSVTLTGSIPASTIGAHTFTIGASGTVTISRAASNLAHMVYYTFYNEVNQAAVSKTTAATLTWAPKMSLCNQLPNAASGTGTIYVVTYNGTTQIGTAQSAALTLKVPASVVPKDLTITQEIRCAANATIAGWGIAVKGYSTIKCTVAASGEYSATISSRKVTVGNQSGNAALSGGSYVWETAKLTQSGSVTPSFRATDSRGRGATKTGSAITIYDYAKPAITQATAFRSDSLGNKSSNGEYCYVKLKGTVTSLDNRNTATLRARYRAQSSNTWSAYTTLTNDTAQTINWNLSYLTTYVVELSISDTVGNATTRTFVIPSDEVVLHLREEGKGVGIGMYAQGANRLDIAWPTYVEKILSPKASSLHTWRSKILTVPNYQYDDVGNTLGDTFASKLENWIRQIVLDYPNETYATFVGGFYASGIGTIVCYVNDCTDVSGGLPKHCGGAYFPYSTDTDPNLGRVFRFGTYNYTYWFRDILPDDVQIGTLEYVSNSVITSAANLGMTLKKSGKVVTLNATSTSVAGVSASSLVTVANIPTGFRPTGSNAVITVPQQTGSAGCYVALYATTDGLLRVIKGGTETAAFRATLTWITA